MTMMKVIRDVNGKVINIGDWDYRIHIEPMPDGSEMEVTGNPYPEGATENDENVIVGWDGGLYVEGDPRAEGH
ncbi:hypothetical protein ABHD38_25090 [Enterobacter cloacae]|uniref:hypothetical protein n=1 Tax=Enterobacteriaceae TaxID=543 RepID=UPI00325B930C|nr:hypothetical protein [Escherichia coli]